MAEEERRSVPEAIKSPACLDPLRDNGIFRPKGKAPAPRALDAELELGLALICVLLHGDGPDPRGLADMTCMRQGNEATENPALQQAMDPVTAFGLAAGIVQVISVSTEAIILCRRLYKDGSLREYDQITETTTKLGIPLLQALVE
ncbi:MAG: hypothetical protein Q9196_007433 [Gyalolechia fulgens]